MMNELGASIIGELFLRPLRLDWNKHGMSFRLHLAHEGPPPHLRCCSRQLRQVVKVQGQKMYELVG